MLYIGDYVRHNTFPPSEGYVSIINQGTVSTEIGVLQSNGVLFYDEESSWDLVIQNTAQESYDGDIIDADFTVIEDS